MKSRLPAIVLVFSAMAGEAAACAVCGGPMPARTLNTYLGITVALSLLPLAMAAAGLAWAASMRRRKKTP